MDEYEKMEFPHYIKNKNVFKAVSFARKMRREGMSTALAIHKAAKYYGAKRDEVAKEMGKIGAAYSGKNKTIDSLKYSDS